MSLIDIDKYVTQKNLAEVTSPRILMAGGINPVSLFSFEIFGSFGSKERLNSFAYIDLKKKFLHPFAIQILKSEGLFNYIIGGNYFKVEGNKLVKSEEEKGLKGLSNLYTHWDKYVNSIEDTGTESRDDMIKFFNKYKREELWMSKWLVLPAGLREINMMELENTGVTNYEPINDLYIDLINNTRQLPGKDTPVDDIFSMITTENIEIKIQMKLLEIHDFITRGKLSGKDKFIRKNTLKRAVMYSAGAVITMAPQNSDRHDSRLTNNIKLGEVGVPITMLIDMFYPFVIHQMNAYIGLDDAITNFIEGNILKGKHDGKKTEKELIEIFLDTAINDKSFLSTVMLRTTDFNGKPLEILVMDFIKNMLLMPVVGSKDNPKKYVLVSRYPIERFKSTQFLIPIPYTTDHVKLVKLSDGSDFEITLDPENYSPALVMNQASLQSYGGDFDGDKVITMGIFTNEANAQIRDKKALFRDNNLDISLNQTTMIGLESLNGLNTLTRAS